MMEKMTTPQNLMDPKDYGEQWLLSSALNDPNNKEESPFEYSFASTISEPEPVESFMLEPFEISNLPTMTQDQQQSAGEACSSPIVNTSINESNFAYSDAAVANVSKPTSTTASHTSESMQIERNLDFLQSQLQSHQQELFLLQKMLYDTALESCSSNHTNDNLVFSRNKTQYQNNNGSSSKNASTCQSSNSTTMNSGCAASRSSSISSNTTTCIDTIVQKLQDKDILCGQSKQCARHIGNRKFQLFLESYVLKYQNARNKQEKMELTKEVVGCIKSSGGRFLKLKDGVWKEISTLAARDKVSHALRTKVATWKRLQQKNNNDKEEKQQQQQQQQQPKMKQESKSSASNLSTSDMDSFSLCFD